MWKEIIQGISRDCRFHDPAPPNVLAEAERVLGLAIPEDLRALVGESNGVEGPHGIGLIWSVQQIQQENLRLRQSEDLHDLYMPFDSLLFFGDAGDGDLFAFAILNSMIRVHDIFKWNHENDSRIWIAPSLRAYLERHLNNQFE